MRFGRKSSKGLPVGAALATLLMILSIAVIVAFSLAGGSIFHLNVASSQDNSSDARDLAETAIAMALESILQTSDLSFGKSQTGRCDYTFGGENGPRGMLTFNHDEAGDEKMPYSTNNLTGPSSIEGWNHYVVPQYSAHLVGKGVCNGVTQIIEAVIHLPPFPYCIATSGQVDSDGGLLLASVKNSADLTDIFDMSGNINRSKLLPGGHMLANSTADDSVLLTKVGDEEVLVYGNIKTAGEVKSDPGVEISGEVRCHEGNTNMTQVDLYSYDPDTESGVTVNYLNGNDTNPVLQGFYKLDATCTDYNVSGNLTLNGALLYIEGNLNVESGVKGKGAIVVRKKSSEPTSGNIIVGKGAILSTDNTVALLCDGNVNIGDDTTSPDTSSFQGLVYTKGNFTAKNVSLFGAFLNAGSSSSVIKLTHVIANRVPEYTTVGGGGDSGVDSITTWIGDGYTHLGSSEDYALTPLKDDVEIDLRKWSPTWEIKKNGTKFDVIRNGDNNTKQTFDYLTKGDDTEGKGSAQQCISDWVENSWLQYMMEKYPGDLSTWLNGSRVVTKDDQAIFMNLKGNWGGDSLEHNVLPQLKESVAGIPLIDLNTFIRPEDRMKVLLWRIMQ